MNGFELARVRAVSWRNDVIAVLAHEGVAQPTGLEVVTRCAVLRGFDVLALDPGDTLLGGAEAALDRGVEAIYHRRPSGASDADSSGEAAQVAVLVAHELGHLALHEGDCACARQDIDAAGTDEPSPVGADRVAGYGPRARQELQANVFARELLLPRETAQRLFAEDGLAASDIVGRLALPHSLVAQQLCDALLLPAPRAEAAAEAEAGPPAPEGESPALDPAQEAAAVHRDAPLLLEAGPGTGKTRTLVARIVHLIEQGIDPASIVALTFSNRAAAEIADRVAAAAPSAVARLWSGTFHAFGLELVRRHHARLDLPAELRVVDRADAIALLEERLPTLGLVHHQNLYEPALELREILAAISRAKDELVGPERYRALADAMAEAADPGDQKAQLTAARAQEVATVYAAYEVMLRTREAIDFGDLIALPTRLLDEHDDVREAVRSQHRHVLVDEYQDVNRASARFLRALVGSGTRLWVVGDARQSIYRFRGASSANMALFAEDFPGAVRRSLEVCYRATEEVVATWSGFARTMAASRGMLPLSLSADRGGGGSLPKMTVAADPDGEIDAIARAVEALDGDGVPYEEQAVLCRSNATLSKVARGLEARGIPVLHLGSLFERDEVRDLLALIAFVAEPSGGALARVAAFPDYAVPAADVQALLRFARGGKHTGLASLAHLDAVPALSTAGKTGLSRLATDLAGLTPRTSPWRLLTTYLFDRSRYLPRRAFPERGASAMTRVALYQFLTFVRTTRPGGRGWPGQRLLRRIRRLVLLGDDRDLRQLPSAARGLNGVAAMTIHASKGLEREAIHVPSMMSRGIPSTLMRPRCPPPEGMIQRAPEDDGPDPLRTQHDAEEECLFFVALSRACSHLRLYRPARVGKTARKPSVFLARLEPPIDVSEAIAGASVAAQTSPHRTTIRVVGGRPSHVRGRDVGMFERCPRRFFYSRVFGLPGSKREGAFVDTHRVLDEVLEALRGCEGEPLDPAAVRALLVRHWSETGPVGHAFEAGYRALAERLLDHLLEAWQGVVTGEVDALTLRLGNGVVRIEPDLVGLRSDGSRVVQLVRTGRKGSFRGDETIHAVAQVAASRIELPTRVEVLHLSDGARTPIEMTERKVATRLERAADTVQEMASGHFPARPDVVRCPRCPYFFVCPTVPRGHVAWAEDER